MSITKIKTALLLSYISIASASAAMITPALPDIEKTFHLSHGALEWVISIFLLGYVVGQLIYGPIANRFGRLTALRSGLVINLIGILICLVSIPLLNYSVLLIGRLVTALGAAAGLSCTFILINELLDVEQAKQAMSFAIVSFTVGIAVSVTIGGLVTQYLHWWDCFWVLLVHGVFMLMSTWQFPETLKQAKSLRPSLLVSGYWHALKSQQLLIFSLVIGFCSVIAYCYSAAAPIIAQTVLRLTPSEYGYWNLVNMLGMLSSGFLAAKLIKRYDVKPVLIVTLVLLIPCLLSLFLLAVTDHPTLIWFFLTTMMLYLLGGILFPCGSIFASNAIEDRANASSMMSFINMAFAMLSVIVMGYLSLSAILSFAFILLGFYLIVAILSLQYLLSSKF